jgi:hypothetical protein
MPTNNAYQVLWIDDEYLELSEFSKDAADNGIVLLGFKSVDEGIQHLKQHLEQIDAVLLDARVFLHKEQAAGTGTVAALSEARTQIDRLSGQRHIPQFVLSGQKGVIDDENFKLTYKNFYKKGSPEETDRLFHDIKAESDEQQHTQMRHRYADAFAACTDRCVSERAGRLLYEALVALNESQLTHGDDLKINTLRQILEEVCIAACRHHLLPPKCVDSGQVNLTGSGKLLAGETAKIAGANRSMTIRLLPDVLAELINTLVNLTHNASHASASGTSSRLLDLRTRVRTPYLQAALTYQVLDLLVWFKALLDDPELHNFQNKWV